MVGRRESGLPLEQVVGWAEFCGLRIVVEPGVFVPRRRTALLVDEAVRLVAGIDSPIVVDLCCGTGAVAAAVHARLPVAEIHASDLDPRAVHCARRNLADVGSVTEGDLTDALPGDLRGRVDLMVVNAPYVPTGAIATMPPEARDHEPHLALDGGPEGVDVHRRVAEQAPRWLSRHGHVLIETSPAQASLTSAAMRSNGLDAIVVDGGPHGGTVVAGSLRPG